MRRSYVDVFNGDSFTLLASYDYINNTKSNTLVGGLFVWAESQISLPNIPDNDWSGHDMFLSSAGVFFAENKNVDSWLSFCLNHGFVILV